MMASHHENVRDYIDNNLPQNFGSSGISKMCSDLQRDLHSLRSSVSRGDMSQKKMEMILHQKHKKLAFSYPGLFFKIVREEVDPVMLESLLGLKKKLDENSISLEDARNRVIDCAKHQIEKTEGKPRIRKSKPPGTVVQELSFKCKPED